MCGGSPAPCKLPGQWKILTLRYWSAGEKRDRWHKWWDNERKIGGNKVWFWWKLSVGGCQTLQREIEVLLSVCVVRCLIFSFDISPCFTSLSSFWAEDSGSVIFRLPLLHIHPRCEMIHHGGDRESVMCYSSQKQQQLAVISATDFQSDISRQKVSIQKLLQNRTSISNNH